MKKRKKSKHEGNFKIGDIFGNWKIINSEIIYDKRYDSSILCECIGCNEKKYVKCRNLKDKLSKGCFKCSHRNGNRWKGYEDIPKTWFNRYPNRAKKSNIEFKIDIKDIWKIYIKQNKKCALTGLKIEFKNINSKTHTSNHRLICTASLDRIDSKKGYILNNIQLVHKDINMMKKEYNQEYFINMCYLVINNLK